MKQNYFFEFGRFRLDPARRLLTRSGQPVPLTPKAFDTLLLLVERQGNLVGKAEMMSALWPDTVVEEGNLAWNVSAARKALADGSDGGTYIETVPKFGYRFVAEVRRVEEESGSLPAIADRAPAVPADPIVADVVPAPPAPAIATAPVAPSRRRWIVTAAGLVAVASAALLWPTVNRRLNSDADRTPPAQVRRLIAVLPLLALQERPGDEYLGIGVADALIGRLARVAGLAVKPTSAIRRYGGRKVDSPAAGRELKVDYVLEGNIDRVHDRYRVSVQLVAVADGATLWGDRFEESTSELMAVEDRIATQVAGALVSGLRDEDRRQLARHATASAAAYESYLRGQYQWNRRTTDGYLKAIQEFEHAVSLDPAYALAYAGVADSYTELGFATMAPNQMFPKAKDAALRGLAHNDAVAEIHAALARVAFNYDWDWAEAERRFARSIELNPFYPHVRHWYAHFLAAMGKFDAALVQTNEGLAIDPRDFRLISHYAWHYLYARDYDKAIEEARRALAIDPTDGFTQLYLGEALRQRQRFSESTEALIQAAKLLENATRAEAELGSAHALAGNPAAARAVLVRLQERAAREYVSPYSFASIYTALGDRDQAFAWLMRALEERSNALVYLRIDPLLDPLRDDARFEGIGRRLGLPRAGR